MSIDLINFIGEKFVTCTAEFDFRSRLRLWNFNELKGRMGNWFWISWFDDQRSKIWFRLLHFSLHLSIRVSFESHVFSNDLRFQIFIHQHTNKIRAIPEYLSNPDWLRMAQNARRTRFLRSVPLPANFLYLSAGVRPATAYLNFHQAWKGGQCLRRTLKTHGRPPPDWLIAGETY